ncbi:MAG: dephospho-CoA kinase [Chloroflexi bacterium]|nr:dephospho-CoA kinase [Chloroflexota bacterium]
MDTVGQRSGPRVLGLTGPIACGKTTVGNLLLELGALDRIDADAVVHELMAAGTPTTARIRSAFGDEVLRPDGSVNRARLGELVFSEPEALVRLEAIVHPAVREAIRRRLGEMAGQTGLVVVDAVKLLQSDLLPLCDAVWVVQCARAAQMDRLTRGRKMPLSSAEARLAAQPWFDHPRVTTRIENSGSMDDLRRRVREAWRSLARERESADPS